MEQYDCYRMDLSYPLSLGKSLHSASEMSTVSKDSITSRIYACLEDSWQLFFAEPQRFSFKYMQFSILTKSPCRLYTTSLSLFLFSKTLPLNTPTSAALNFDFSSLKQTTDICFGSPFCAMVQKSQKVRLNLKLTLCFPSIKNYSFLLFVVK